MEVLSFVIDADCGPAVAALGNVEAGVDSLAGRGATVGVATSGVGRAMQELAGVQQARNNAGGNIEIGYNGAAIAAARRDLSGITSDFQGAAQARNDLSKPVNVGVTGGESVGALADNFSRASSGARDFESNMSRGSSAMDRHSAAASRASSASGGAAQDLASHTSAVREHEMAMAGATRAHSDFGAAVARASSVQARVPTGPEVIPGGSGISPRQLQNAVGSSTGAFSASASSVLRSPGVLSYAPAPSTGGPPGPPPSGPPSGGSGGSGTPRTPRGSGGDDGGHGGIHGMVNVAQMGLMVGAAAELIAGGAGLLAVNEVIKANPVLADIATNAMLGFTSSVRAASTAAAHEAVPQMKALQATIGHFGSQVGTTGAEQLGRTLDVAGNLARHATNALHDMGPAIGPAITGLGGVGEALLDGISNPNTVAQIKGVGDKLSDPANIEGMKNVVSGVTNVGSTLAGTAVDVIGHIADAAGVGGDQAAGPVVAGIGGGWAGGKMGGLKGGLVGVPLAAGTEAIAEADSRAGRSSTPGVALGALGALIGGVTGGPPGAAGGWAAGETLAHGPQVRDAVNDLGKDQIPSEVPGIGGKDFNWLDAAPKDWAKRDDPVAAQLAKAENDVGDYFTNTSKTGGLLGAAERATRPDTLTGGFLGLFDQPPKAPPAVGGGSGGGPGSPSTIAKLNEQMAQVDKGSQSPTVAPPSGGSSSGGGGGESAPGFVGHGDQTRPTPGTDPGLGVNQGGGGDGGGPVGGGFVGVGDQTRPVPRSFEIQAASAPGPTVGDPAPGHAAAATATNAFDPNVQSYGPIADMVGVHSFVTNIEGQPEVGTPQGMAPGMQSLGTPGQALAAHQNWADANNAVAMSPMAAAVAGAPGLAGIAAAGQGPGFVGQTAINSINGVGAPTGSPGYGGPTASTSPASPGLTEGPATASGFGPAGLGPQGSPGNAGQVGSPSNIAQITADTNAVAANTTANNQNAASLTNVANAAENANATAPATNDNAQAVAGLGDNASNAATSVAGLSSVVGAAAPGVAAAGMAMGQGFGTALGDGISGATAASDAAAGDAASSAGASAASSAGVDSPSKVWKQIGGWMTEGMAIGITNAAPMAGAAAGAAVMHTTGVAANYAADAGLKLGFLYGTNIVTGMTSALDTKALKGGGLAQGVGSELAKVALGQLGLGGAAGSGAQSWDLFNAALVSFSSGTPAKSTGPTPTVTVNLTMDGQVVRTTAQNVVWENLEQLHTAIGTAPR